MVGIITNISYCKDASFLSISKALSDKIKFSLLKKRCFLVFVGKFFIYKPVLIIFVQQNIPHL